MVNAVTSESVSLLTKKGEDIKDVKQKITLNKSLKAPVEKGDKVGTLKLVKNGKVLAETQLVADTKVEKAGWWTLYKRSFGMFTRAGSQK